MPGGEWSATLAQDRDEPGEGGIDVRVLLTALCLLGAAGAERATAQLVITATQLVQDGGRLDWYTGASHSLIAFDAGVGEGASEVFTVEPDGSDRRCVTCATSLSDGYVGQPSWHPDGERLVVQVENENSPQSFLNSLLWGFDNDLWLVRRDGSAPEKIWDTPPGWAALHPHFDDSGTRLVFVERFPNPGDEQDRWKNWQIKIAEFDDSQSGLAKLSNIRTLRPNGAGVYEAHGFVGAAGLLYTFSPAGVGRLDDIYFLAPGAAPKNVTQTPDSIWNEHGHTMPTNPKVMAFMSDRLDAAIPLPRPFRTELYLTFPGQPGVRITNFNKTAEDEYIVKDMAWNADGTRIAFLVTGTGFPAPQIWTINFSGS